MYCHCDESKRSTVLANAFVESVSKSDAPWRLLDVLQLISSNQFEAAQQKASVIRYDLVPMGNIISNSIATKDFQSAQEYLNNAIEIWVVTESAHSQCHQHHILLCNSNNLSFLQSLARYRKTHPAEKFVHIDKGAVSHYIHAILHKAVEKKSADCEILRDEKVEFVPDGADFSP